MLSVDYIHKPFTILFRAPALDPPVDAQGFVMLYITVQPDTRLLVGWLKRSTKLRTPVPSLPAAIQARTKGHNCGLEPSNTKGSADRVLVTMLVCVARRFERGNNSIINLQKPHDAVGCGFVWVRHGRYRYILLGRGRK